MATTTVVTTTVVDVTTSGTNYTLLPRAKPTAPYPDVREAGGLLFVSGASSRLPHSQGFEGVVVGSDGKVEFDVQAQTKAVIQNLQHSLRMAGADLSDVVQTSCFLVDMRDMPAFNKGYAAYFNAKNGPTRTTVAVRELPHPHIKVEISCIALARKAKL